MNAPLVSNHIYVDAGTHTIVSGVKYSQRVPALTMYKFTQLHRPFQLHSGALCITVATVIIPIYMPLRSICTTRMRFVRLPMQNDPIHTKNRSQLLSIYHNPSRPPLHFFALLAFFACPCPPSALISSNLARRTASKPSLRRERSMTSSTPMVFLPACLKKKNSWLVFVAYNKVQVLRLTCRKIQDPARQSLSKPKQRGLAQAARD